MPTLCGWDSETFLFGPGNMAPEPVIASFYDGAQAWFNRYPNPFDQDDAGQVLEGLLRPGVVLATANGAYDEAVDARANPSHLKLFFDKHERNEMFDIEIAAALDAIAEGRMYDGGLRDRNGATLRKFYPDGPATNRFSLLNCVYLYLGRLDAKQNDAYRLLYGQLSKLPREQWPEEAKVYPLDDARNPYDVARVMMGATGSPAQNLGPMGCLPWTHLQLHTYAAFCMHLGSVWGFRTDGSRVNRIMAEVNKGLEKELKFFREAGLYKITGRDLKAKRDGSLHSDDGKTNKSRLKLEVVLAYGGDASKPCVNCLGTGKMPSPTTGKPIICKGCHGAKIEIPASCPRTDGDDISTDRDVLEGTLNPLLERWVDHQRGAKMRETYSPWLLKGVDASINDRPNPVIASCRASYDGLVQLIPKAARECIRAREGYYFFSDDFGSGELCTLAQATYTTTGASRMRDVINATNDPGALHTEFAAKLAGIRTDDHAAIAAFKKRAKVKGSREAGMRQMSKAANFGFPGGMGPATFVLQKRKEGLYFCVASGMNKECAKPVLEWHGKPLKRPTCPDCLEVAAKLRDDWFETWPEVKPYFEWVNSHEGISSGNGVMINPLTGMVRGGLNFMSGANNSFQYLLAIAAKRALCRVSREAYCDPDSVLWGTRPIIFVHDELWGETPIHMAHLAAPRVAQIMIESGKEVCPDITGWQVEPTLTEYWYKAAEPCYENGKLVCWHPRDEAGNRIEWAPH